MSTRVLAAKPKTAPFFTRPREGAKGKCTCSGGGSECAECKKKSKAAQELRQTAYQPQEANGSMYPRFGHDFSRLRLHDEIGPAGFRSGNGVMQWKPVREADADGQCDGMLPCEVKGTPTPIPAGDNSIVCQGGNLTVQNNNSGPDRSCTQAHESSHIGDWKGRYGNDLCKGVKDGSLPLGGDGYDEFLRTSECTAYGVGKGCRVELLKKAADKDKPAIQAGIDRDNAQLSANKCS